MINEAAGGKGRGPDCQTVQGRTACFGEQIDHFSFHFIACSEDKKTSDIMRCAGMLLQMKYMEV